MRGARSPRRRRLPHRGAAAVTQVAATTLTQLQEVARRFKETVEAREAAEAARRVSEEGRAALEAEIKALQAEIAAAKAANQKVADTTTTPRPRPATSSSTCCCARPAGRSTRRRDRSSRSTGMPNAQGMGLSTTCCGATTASRWRWSRPSARARTPRVGQQQAKLYADCLEQQFGQRPVIFYTNGYEHWLWDDTRYPPRAVQGFYKKDELELLIQRREHAQAARAERRSTERSSSATTRSAPSAASPRRSSATAQRKALLVMATGAGKTRTVIALVDLLMRAQLGQARAVPRRPHGAGEPGGRTPSRRTCPTPRRSTSYREGRSEGRVYVSTYPTMMGLIDETQDGERRFGVGPLRPVVIDEAHRSVYQKYRAIFDYFDCLLVGLTATPKDEVDRNTYRLFDLRDRRADRRLRPRRGGEGRLPRAAARRSRCR